MDERLATTTRWASTQSDGGGSLRHGLRPRLRFELWLLVHQLSGRPARDGCQKYGCGTKHSARCCGAENVLSFPRHRSRHDRRGANRDAFQGLPHPAAGHFAGKLLPGDRRGEKCKPS